MVRSGGGRLGRWLGLLGVAGLLGGGYGLIRSVLNEQEVRRREAEDLAPPPPLTGFALKGGLRATAEQLDEPYRLAVDARLRTARELSERLAEGEAPSPWVLTFPPGHDFDAAQPFPDPPTFADAVAAVSGHAPETQMHKLTAIDPGTWLLPPAEALALIREQTAGQAEPPDALKAARAVISLLFHSPDRLGAGVYLASLALRWLSAAEQHLQADLVGEKALLARALGYSEESRALARQLPLGAFPAYLRFDDDALRAAAPDPSVRPLWFRRQLELNDSEESLTYRALPAWRHWSLVGVGRLLSTTALEPTLRAAESCQALVELGVAELAGAKVQPLHEQAAALVGAASEEGRAKALQQRLALEVAKPAGLNLEGLGFLGRIERWLERAIEGDVSEVSKRSTEEYVVDLAGSCVSAMIEAHFRGAERDKQLPLAPAATFAGVERPLFAQLERWQGLRQMALDEGVKAGAVTAEAEDLTALGPRAHYLLFRDLAAHVALARGESVPLARYLIRHLDTRPRALRWAAEQIPQVLLDRRYQQYFYRSWSKVAASSDPELARFWSDFSNRSARDARSTLATPTEYQLRAALDGTRDDWRERRLLTDFLEQEGRWEEIPPIVDPWLRANPTAVGSGLEWALTSLAKLELARNEPKRAKALLDPIAQGPGLRTLVVGGKVALALQDLALAEAFSRRGLELAPKAPQAVGLALEAAWVAGRNEEATALARGMQQHAPAGWVSGVSQAFFESFRSRSPDDAALAFRSSVLALEAPELLLAAGELFHRRSLDEHCARLAELPVSAAKWQARISVLGYVCRRAKGGDERATLDWLSGRWTAEARALAPVEAYRARVDEVLWKLPAFEATLPAAGTDQLWALRAASAVRAGAAVDPRVTRYFGPRPDGNGYWSVGRFLSDQMAEAELIASAGDDPATGRVTYYLGLMADAQGRAAEAIVWYRASVQTNAHTIPELELARERLEEIHQLPLPLSAFGPAAAPAPALVE